MCDCTNFKLEGDKTGPCLQVLADFKCYLCLNNKYRFHDTNSHFECNYYECATCNKYIIYFKEDNSFLKEDFIFNDYIIVRYPENCFVLNTSKMVETIKLPYFDFNEENYLHKIKTYSLFQ